MRDAESPRVKWYDSRELSAAASVWLIVCCHAMVRVGGRVGIRIRVGGQGWVRFCMAHRLLPRDDWT